MNIKPLSQAAKTAVPIPAEINVQTSLKTDNSKPEQNTLDQITRKDAEEISEVMNKISEMVNTQLKFEVYEETNTVYVQIVDRETKEVVKQIPPEEMLELSAKIREMVGILLDEYV